MTLVERWTTRSGPRIRYVHNGGREGLPLLFVPGFSDTADEYVEMLEFFAPRPVLVVEVRGRGRSAAPPSGYAAADHTADLRAVLDEEGVDRFHLMTFSRGTTWGLDLAASAAQRVASVSIADYWAAEVQPPAGFVDSQWSSRFRGRPISERLPRHVVEQVIGDSTPRDLWDALRALPCPLLVARPGGPGGILSDEDISRYRAVRPDVEVVVVPDAPHDVFRPDRLFVAKAVAEFVERAERRRPAH